MQVGPFQILIIALVLLVLFGRGRISGLMGDFGKGVKSFRKGIADEDEPGRPAPVPRIEAPGAGAMAASDTAVDPKPASDQTNG